MFTHFQPPLKIGHSVDYHNLIPTGKYSQKLGGVEFELDYKIMAHSDGDIILHSISEAILGALGLGDLGQWFNDEEVRNKNLNSLEILDLCIKKCNDYNYDIMNIDISIVCDLIMFNDKKDKIIEFLTKYLDTNVNLKATRFEQKNGSKIKCYSICLLMNKYIF